LPENIFLSVGVVDGRNIWRVNAAKAGSIISKAIDAIGIDRVMVAPSSSLLHVPIDIEPESKLDSEIKSWMSFAKQKCVEIAKLAADAKGEDVSGWLSENAEKISNRNSSKKVNNEPVQKRIKSLTGDDSVRKTVFAERKKLQQDKFNLPLMPTTTIGSFPQTLEIRSERRKFKKGDSSPGEYQTAMQGFIKDAVDKQIDLGLDVLVHGEPERNDMVEYFGEQLSGFCFTENGWVQSYGSRCVKPPVIFGDVSRPEPMTVDWIKYAQSLTTKPMKGMLTGPVTIMCWSFVRDDQPREATCRQLAVAIRDEVNDLEAAGIDIIQIDEAALREGLPLNKSEWDAYLSWAVECFRISTSGVKDTTQIHTHMCYSEFNEIAEWIAKMDADVISIEASRSKMELLKAFKDFNYPNDIGPGVYDIHSPRVPSTEEILELLECALEVIPAERLWINPDCGLKTRGWKESLESLKNMVNAAKAIRNKISVST
jgi:5-methyltetrahydropteroyltriglutamate--homocysteine methyltransferase